MSELMCVSMCVCERGREIERECVYVCVCVCDRERERDEIVCGYFETFHFSRKDEFLSSL